MPETTLTEFPSATARRAKFAWTTSEPTISECRWDGGAVGALRRDRGRTGARSPGPHTFETRATDGLGRVEAEPERWAWTITGAEAARRGRASGGDDHLRACRPRSLRHVDVHVRQLGPGLDVPLRLRRRLPGVRQWHGDRHELVRRSGRPVASGPSRRTGHRARRSSTGGTSTRSRRAATSSTSPAPGIRARRRRTSSGPARTTSSVPSARSTARRTWRARPRTGRPGSPRGRTASRSS